MELCRTVDEMRGVSAAARRAGREIGFVPTMGALHAGHASLIDAARRDDGLAVVSIFVNPTQFGPNEDYARYPRDEAGDLALCRAGGVDAVFLPTVEAMYPPGAATRVSVPSLAGRLCGVFRPGHFDGVATVVAKLLHIVTPDRAYFGEKDAQQLAIIRRMARDLDLPVRIVGCPIIREPDGLALSSRNAYLSPAEREQARCISAALRTARSSVSAGERESSRLIAEMTRVITDAGACRIDYVSIVDPDSLEDMPRVESRALAAIAVHIGRTRLIDNMTLG